jgi:hypothetical protein
MIENLPEWIEWFFLLTCIITIGLFHFSNGRPKWVTLIYCSVVYRAFRSRFPRILSRNTYDIAEIWSCIGAGRYYHN